MPRLSLVRAAFRYGDHCSGAMELQGCDRTKSLVHVPSKLDTFSPPRQICSALRAICYLT